MIGAEMPKMDAFTLSLMTNEPLLRITKDTHCAHPLYTNDSESVWVAPKKDGSGIFTAVFNLSDEERVMEVNFEENDLPVTAKPLRELWTGKEVPNSGKISCAVAPHDCCVWYIAR